MTTPRQLRRSTSRVIGGVCGGLAEYFDIDPTIIRVVWLALTILSMGVGGVILYLLAWAIMPGPLTTGVEHANSEGTAKTLLGVVLIAVGILLLLVMGLMSLRWGGWSPWLWHWSWHWPFASLRFLLPVLLLAIGVVLIVVGVGSRSPTAMSGPMPQSSGEGESQAEETAGEKAPVRRLYRSLRNRKIAGICGGLGDYLNVDPTLIRVLWILLILYGGTGILIYLILWVVVPQEPIYVSPPTTM